MTYPYDEADCDKNSYRERMVSTYLKLKEYDLAFEVNSHLENRQEQLLSVADVENEMNKSKVIISDKIEEVKREHFREASPTRAKPECRLLTGKP